MGSHLPHTGISRGNSLKGIVSKSFKKWQVFKILFYGLCMCLFFYWSVITKGKTLNNHQALTVP